MEVCWAKNQQKNISRVIINLMLGIHRNNDFQQQSIAKLKQNYQQKQKRKQKNGDADFWRISSLRSSSLTGLPGRQPHTMPFWKVAQRGAAKPCSLIIAHCSNSSPLKVKDFWNSPSSFFIQLSIVPVAVFSESIFSPPLLTLALNLFSSFFLQLQSIFKQLLSPALGFPSS